MPAETRKAALSPRLLMPEMLVLALVLGATCLLMNDQEVRLMPVRYRPGNVVRFKHEEAPCGRVLQYDPEHRFHAGEAGGDLRDRSRRQVRTVPGQNFNCSVAQSLSVSTLKVSAS